MQTDKMQLGAPFYIHVFWRRSHKPARTYSRPASLPGHCGTYYAFSGTNYAMPSENRRIDVTVDVTHCMAEAGVRPDVAPRLAGRPDQGPKRAPLALSDLVWVATWRNGTALGSGAFKFGKPVLSWTVLNRGKLSVGTA
jgi:hypothetical protein